MCFCKHQNEQDTNAQLAQLLNPKLLWQLCIIPLEWPLEMQPRQAEETRDQNPRPLRMTQLLLLPEQRAGVQKLLLLA